jgi:uncharacterized cupin superfamily protein
LTLIGASFRQVEPGANGVLEHLGQEEQELGGLLGAERLRIARAEAHHAVG